MFKKIKESIVVAASVLLFAVPVLAPVSVHATDVNDDIKNNLCQGIELSADAGSDASCNNVNSSSTSSANSLLRNIINVFSLVVGIVAVLMIIFAGFKYITSGGKGDSVSGAKNTILYAVIGLVIVALAQVIVRFVLNKATQTI